LNDRPRAPTVGGRGDGSSVDTPFSDIGPDDAPTRTKAGSHLDVPPFVDKRMARSVCRVDPRPPDPTYA